MGYLLDSIVNQSVQPREIVVVDAYSQDKTIEQARMRQNLLPQLKIFQIPKFTLKSIRSFFRVVRKGYRDNPLEYEFGHFTAVDQPRKRS